MSMNRLSARQKKKRRKRIAVTIVILVVLAAAATVLLMMLQRNITEKYASQEEIEVQSATVTTGSIRTTVAGSGSLAYEESEEVVLPAGVIIDEVMVSQRSTVEEGDLLATVNAESVITAMAELQAKLDDLDVELSEAETEEVASEITAPVAGRVKIVYADEEEDVSAVMYENGALVLLSLDGYMTLDIERDPAGAAETEDTEAESDGGRRSASREAEKTEEEIAEEIAEEEAVAAAAEKIESLKVGDTVTITDSYGDSFEGTVDRITDSAIRILAPDDQAVYGDQAKAMLDGVELGSGTFAIHEGLAITGYAGTVEEVHTGRGRLVEAGDTLITLTNTTYTAHYESLLKERAELEAQLQELIRIYQEGGLYAPISGTVDSVSYNSRNATASSSETTVLTIRPSDTIVITVYVDESDILSLEAGQEATVTISSIDEETFTATVTEIDTEGTSSGGVTQYAVTMTMACTDDMRSGMSATAAIAIAGAEDALILPEEAVQQSRDTYYVYTTLDEESGSPAGTASVEIGVSGNGNIEIVSGLSEGDTVYYTVEEETNSFGGFGSSSSSRSSSREMGGGR